VAGSFWETISLSSCSSTGGVGGRRLRFFIWGASDAEVSLGPEGRELRVDFLGADFFTAFFGAAFLGADFFFAAFFGAGFFFAAFLGAALLAAFLAEREADFFAGRRRADLEADLFAAFFTGLFFAAFFFAAFFFVAVLFTADLFFAGLLLDFFAALADFFFVAIYFDFAVDEFWGGSMKIHEL
jgi:hypothetical protein